MAKFNESYLTEHFQEALEKQQIQAYFQPIYRSMTGKILCAESLARWIDPEKGMITPAEFVPVLEKHGMISDLDLGILRQACAAYKNLSDRGTPIYSFSVNLSRHDFDRESLFEDIVATLKAFDVPHEAIKLEITESVMLEDTEAFCRVIQKFHDAGFSVWIDDFGSGYSSLNVLQEYSFDVLKFDMFFLHNLTAKGRNLLASQIFMAKTLGIHTLTEGVETEEQRDFLVASGCEAVQGYYYSRPLSRDDFFSMVEKQPEILETAEDKKYWDEIGHFNLLSPNPLKDYEKRKTADASMDFSSFDSSTALVECTLSGFHYIYATEAYKDRLRDLGFGSVNGLESALDHSRSAQYLVLRKLFIDAIQKGTMQKIEYAYKDVYYRISAQLLSRKTGTSMLALRLNTYDTVRESQTDQKLLDYSSALFTTYDLVVAIYPERNAASRLYTANNLPIYNREPSVESCVAKFCESEIVPDDQERYLQFMDFRTLPERIEKYGNQFVQGYFRLRWTNHPSCWRASRVTRIPSSFETMYLLTFQAVQDFEAEYLDRSAAEQPEMLFRFTD